MAILTTEVRTKVQVARDLEQQMALGPLLPGDRLPSERTLASQLGISRNTVSAAYLVLEKRGAIRPRSPAWRLCLSCRTGRKPD
jgi:GntR family transcriptional regulator/MocR family aminotransferase